MNFFALFVLEQQEVWFTWKLCVPGLYHGHLKGHVLHDGGVQQPGLLGSVGHRPPLPAGGLNHRQQMEPGDDVWMFVRSAGGQRWCVSMETAMPELTWQSRHLPHLCRGWGCGEKNMSRQKHKQQKNRPPPILKITLALGSLLSITLPSNQLTVRAGGWGVGGLESRSSLACVASVTVHWDRLYGPEATQTGHGAPHQDIFHISLACFSGHVCHMKLQPSGETKPFYATSFSASLAPLNIFPEGIKTFNWSVLLFWKFAFIL